MKIARIIVVIAGIALVIGVANNMIRKHQQVVEAGRQVLLELRPVDPRSLIQGDYMLLRYAEDVFPPAETIASLPDRGTLVLSVDANNVGTFARFDDGTPIAAEQVRLQFRHRGMFREPSIGAETFNFEEGQAEIYADAKYGVLRVDERGMSVLVGLADEGFALITP